LLKERSSGPGAAPIIATKFFPMPWRLRSAALVRAVRGSLRRLGLEKIDLYQVHWPVGPRDVTHWARALADAHGAGFVRAVGVSNYDVPQMLRAHDALAARGVPLSSNQVGFSLLNRSAERSGLLDAARELGVTVIAYGPLGEGLLSGKYSSDRPPPLLRRVRYARKWLPKLPPLIGLMREIGRAHGAAAPAQVALAWCIEKGTVPIPGIKTPEHARDAAAAMSLRLSPDETAALDRATAAY
jgi:aryl-alcohol dehydrogenase-like predicted oxidoreductase